jgi:membrane-bound lytic murein transglycosylase B
VNSDIEPSDAATAGIPPTMLRAYRSTAGVCPGLPWTVIAGIGKVESNHARHGGARLDEDLFVRPPIIGIPLDGRPGVATIPDTDNGELDQDPEWDRAVGPFQFIPSTWALLEAAAGGPRNPHYLPDGLEAVVWHLCPNGELDDIEAALLGYNRSQAYVDKVLRWADVYDTATAVSPIIDSASPDRAKVRTRSGRRGWPRPASSLRWRPARRGISPP